MYTIEAQYNNSPHKITLFLRKEEKQGTKILILNDKGMRKRNYESKCVKFEYMLSQF